MVCATVVSTSSSSKQESITSPIAAKNLESGYLAFGVKIEKQAPSAHLMIRVFNRSGAYLTQLYTPQITQKRSYMSKYRIPLRNLREVAFVEIGFLAEPKTEIAALPPEPMRSAVAGPRRDAVGEAQQKLNRASNALDGTESSAQAAEAAAYRLQHAVCADALKSSGLSDAQIARMCREQP